MKYFKNSSTLLVMGLFSIAILLGIWLHEGIYNQALSITELHQNDFPVSTALSQAEPAIPVTMEKVVYGRVVGQEISGYLARPQETKGTEPGIIAIHEWWGVNENIKAVTKRLAGEGYQVLAVDLYNGQVANTPEQAKQLVKSVQENQTLAKDNLRQAYSYLETSLKASKIGSIGWCFGGSWSLKTALLFPEELDATVIYYGSQINQVSQKELSTLTMPILGIFGAEDEGIPLATVKEFEVNLNSLGKSADIQICVNAGHAFANPSGNRYVPEAAQKAWNETTKFFKAHLF